MTPRYDEWAGLAAQISHEIAQHDHGLYKEGNELARYHLNQAARILRGCAEAEARKKRAEETH